MLIKFQNCNQKKYYESDFDDDKFDKNKDKLCVLNRNFYERFYIKILEAEPDIIILAEVTKAKNIKDGIDKYKPDIYSEFHNKDLIHVYSNESRMVYNKIQIFYKKSVFDIMNEPDESLYIENGFFDYLHLSLKRKSDKKIFDVIGLRIKGISYTKNPTEKDIKENRFKNNEINIAISELLHKISGFDNVIIGGDFNHGIIEKKEKDYIQYSYNFQTLYRIVSKMNYTLLTKGLQINNGDINSDDFECCFDETEWTHQTETKRSPIDHFIISNNLKISSYDVIHDGAGVDNIAYVYGEKANTIGIPDHRIIELKIND